MKPGISSCCTKTIKTVSSDGYPDVVIEEISIQIDHIHIVLVILPKYSISKVVGDIKRISEALTSRLDLECGLAIFGVFLYGDVVFPDNVNVAVPPVIGMCEPGNRVQKNMIDLGLHMWILREMKMLKVVI